jgi:hypothetical protein
MPNFQEILFFENHMEKYKETLGNIHRNWDLPNQVFWEKKI